MKLVMDIQEMRPDAQDIAITEDLALPWDFAEWFDGPTIGRWVAEDVETLDWANPEVVEHLRLRPGYDPKALLCLLTYAYATAVFESDEIQRRCDSEPEYRKLAGRRAAVGGSEITRFRRENRGLLKWALVQFFKRAIRARLGDVLLPAGLKRRLLNAAVTRLDLARQMDRGHEGF
jgi:hypothetical protein